MIAGATAHPIDRFDPERLRTLIATERLSFLQGPPGDVPGPPRRHRRVHATLRNASGSVESVRVGVTGSANIPPALIVRMRDTLGLDAVHAGYGLTEATGVCTMTRADDPLALVTETSGRAIPGVEVRIVAPDDEIEVRGVGVMRGYLDDPDATAAVMRPGGWLATGDVGRARRRRQPVDPRSPARPGDRRRVQRVPGRARAGARPSIPRSRQAAVVGVPDDARGEIPVAFVIAADTADPDTTDTDALLGFVRERLASYKVPRHVWWVDDFPLTPVPKVDKVALAARSRAPALGISDR